MSTIDTLMPLVLGPWLDATGKQAPSMPVPGLPPETIKTLELSFSVRIDDERRELLRFCSGLHGTVLGSVDFTGCFFPPESLSVFRPCITLAVDDLGRRWIAETSGDSTIAGRVWSVWPDPKVALLVADDLGQFIATLREHTRGNSTLAWLQGLESDAWRIWANRHSRALRPYQAHRFDATIHEWIATLPADAFVYDLRGEKKTRGWPYGLLGSSAKLYRYGSLPIFAVAGWPVESPYWPNPAEHLPGSAAREFPTRSTVVHARNEQCCCSAYSAG